MSLNDAESIRLFLCGDVMTGRGIDQILPSAGNPVLYESYVRDAREYVKLAESVHGPIPQPVNFEYIWGDALCELQQAKPDVRIINLEASITSSEDHWLGKDVLYRMHPHNIIGLTAAGIDCCCLANNHVLDWGHQGLIQTLWTLDMAGVAHAGAGRDGGEARAPAVLDMSGKGRVLVCSIGSTTAGIPRPWAATVDRPGVNLLDNLSQETASRIGSELCEIKRSGDVAVASIHWGGNWGYEIPNEQVEFAHRLVDSGFDVVHGHSSHHIKAMEVYHGHLILYGCGDFLTDYEGISGYEQFRSDLSLMYLVNVEPEQGRVVELRLTPMQTRRFQLNHVSVADTNWLCHLLNALGERFGTSAHLEADKGITLEWRRS